MQRPLPATETGNALGVVELVLTVGELVDRASDVDLIVLGIQRQGWRRRVFGPLTRELIQASDCPLILISAR